ALILTMVRLETEPELIGKALAGDRFAAERLFERHRPAVVQTAHRALGNMDDAYDVAQEALLYALSRLTDLRDRSKFGAWLRQLTLSHWADYRRRRTTRRLGEPMHGLEEASEEADFTQRLMLQQALEHLSEDHRGTLLLHYASGWSVAEVASLLS